MQSPTDVLSHMESPTDNVVSRMESPTDNVVSHMQSPTDNVVSHVESPTDNVVSHIESPTALTLSVQYRKIIKVNKKYVSADQFCPRKDGAKIGTVSGLSTNGDIAHQTLHNCTKIMELGNLG